MNNESTPPKIPKPPTPPPPEHVPNHPARSHPPSLQAVPSPPAGARAGSYYPNPDERSAGMLMHLLGLFTGLLGPLVLWLVRKDSSPFIDHHGKESLNFQITIVIVLFGGMIFAGGLIFLTPGSALFLICLVVLFLSYLVLIVVWEITACLRAHQGEWYTYPMNIRIIR